METSELIMSKCHIFLWLTILVIVILDFQEPHTSSWVLNEGPPVTNFGWACVVLPINIILALLQADEKYKMQLIYLKCLYGNEETHSTSLRRTEEFPHVQDWYECAEVICMQDQIATTFILIELRVFYFL